MAIALGRFWIENGTPGQAWISASFSFEEFIELESGWDENNLNPYDTTSVEEALFFSTRQDAEIFCCRYDLEGYALILFDVWEI